MRRLTWIESDTLLAQTFDNTSTANWLNLELCRRVSALFCQLLRVPEGFDVVVMGHPQWFYGHNEQVFTALTRRFRVNPQDVVRQDPVCIAEDICISLEKEMLEYYAEHGERCYLGLYWLPWRSVGDILWCLRYVLAHEEYVTD